MNAEPDRPDDADAPSVLVCEFLDGEELLALSDDEWSQQSEEDRQRITDLFALHALLERVHADPNQTEQRIRRVLSNLDADPSLTEPATIPLPMRSRARRRWLVTGLSMAAAIGGIAMLFLFSGITPTAQAALARAIEAANQLVDRSYRVVIQPARGPRGPISCELFVRGGTELALSYPALLMGNIWLGYDGQQAWIAPPRGPILVSTDPKLLSARLPDDELDMELLSVSTILARLRDHYSLELLPGERLEQDDPAPWQRLRGTRRPDHVLGPTTIDLWADPSTGVVRRLVLLWPQTVRGQARRITFDLTGEAPMPADWYGHNAHHGPGRVVLER